MSMRQLLKLSRIQNLMPQLRPRKKNNNVIKPRKIRPENAASDSPERSSLPEIVKKSGAPTSSTKKPISKSKPTIETSYGGTERKPKTKEVSGVQTAEKKTISKSASDSLVSSFSKLRIDPRTSSRSLTRNPSRSRRYISTLSVSSVNELANLIKVEKCKNIIVMAGAGISTPSGIPDFRTPGCGLYDNLAEYDLPDPTAVFDIGFFAYNPKPFFKLAKELYPGNYQPNIVHHFIKLLHDKGVLLRMYTQNIDALERAAGVPESKLVEAHGSFTTATCRRCKSNYKGDEIEDDVMNGEIPKCRDTGCSGVIKPDIIFFGEDLPKRFFQYPRDFARCDLLIVMGTSLEVEPFAGLVHEVSRTVPRLLINRDVVGPFVKRKKRGNDVILKGDIVKGVKELVSHLAWTDELNDMIQTTTKTSDGK